MWPLLVRRGHGGQPASQELKENQETRGPFSSGPQDAQASLEVQDLKGSQEILGYQTSSWRERDRPEPEGPRA